MTQKEKTYTQQLDWSHHHHGWGAVTEAAKKIVAGRIVKFDIFDRGETSTNMVYKSTFFFGKVELEPGEFAIRLSHTRNLVDAGTGSIISTAYPDAVVDPVAVAARLMLVLAREGQDCFINNDERD